jgi:hypothetical protein
VGPAGGEAFRDHVAGGLATLPGVLAARGEWVTNEKRLIDRARLRPIDELLASLSPEAGHLIGAVATAAGLVQTATGQHPVTLERNRRGAMRAPIMDRMSGGS